MTQAKSHLSLALDADSSPARADLFTAVVAAEHAPLSSSIVAATLTPAGVSEVFQTARGLLGKHGPPVTIEITCIRSQEALAWLGLLEKSDDIRVDFHLIEPPQTPTVLGEETTAARAQPAAGEPQAPGVESGEDPFRMCPRLRGWLEAVARSVFARPSLVSIRGCDFLPRQRSSLVFCTTEAPLCWSAAVVATAFDAFQERGLGLRIMYDKETAALPAIGLLLNSLGGVPAGFTNARVLLESGQSVCLLVPRSEPIDCASQRVESTSMGLSAARLSVLTATPIVPALVSKARISKDRRPLAAEREGLVAEVKTALGLHHVGDALSFILSPCRIEVDFLPPIDPPQQAAGDSEEAAREIAQRLRRMLHGGRRPLGLGQPNPCPGTIRSAGDPLGRGE